MHRSGKGVQRQLAGPLIQNATVKREEKRQGFLQELSSGAAVERRNKRKENPDPEKLQEFKRAKNSDVRKTNLLVVLDVEKKQFACVALVIRKIELSLTAVGLAVTAVELSISAFEDC